MDNVKLQSKLNGHSKSLKKTTPNHKNLTLKGEFERIIDTNN